MSGELSPPMRSISFLNCVFKDSERGVDNFFEQTVRRGVKKVSLSSSSTLDDELLLGDPSGFR